MFEGMIEQLEQMMKELEPKKANKLKVQQFLNLLRVLQESQLIDDRISAREIEAGIADVHQMLTDISQDTYGDRTKVKGFKKAYTKLLAGVKKDFGLEPEGSIQAMYVGVGIALGSGVGAALMAATNPGFMGIGISMGIVFGAAFGRQKEKEAKLAGKLF